MKKVMLVAALAAFSLILSGAEFYVSQTKGTKKAPGTKQAPFRAIPDALKKAKPGDVIHVAQGKYAGKMGASEIVFEKPVTVIGGYSPDFSARDVVKYPTMIQPPNQKNDTKGQGVITLKLPNGKGPDMVIDGLIIDQGFMNSYHDIKGKPAGVETGMWLQGPAKGSKDKFPSANVYSIYAPVAGRFEGNIVVRNCIIANSGNFGINISLFQGNVRIVNNLFVGCRMTACDVSSAKRQVGAVKCEFAYNTVFFTWSRISDLADMGYGFRCRENVASNIHHNIFGLNVFSGVGNDIGVAKNKKIKLDNNVFFLNKKSDVTVTKSPNILHLKVGTEEFEDMDDFPGMESVEGNVSLKDPAAFKGRINQAYLTAFLGATYSEKTSYDPNSPANVFRSALGINQRGTIQTKVSMFCNRYPLADTFKLFGACKGYGAQIVK